jgi:hypothetical protein
MKTKFSPLADRRSINQKTGHLELKVNDGRLTRGPFDNEIAFK